MSRTVRVVALIAIFAVLGGVVAAIAVYTARSDASGYEPPKLYIDGSVVDDQGVFLTVGTHEVTFMQYYYFWNAAKGALGESEDYWKDDPDKTKIVQLKKQAESYMKTWFAWIDLSAEAGVVLTEEELADLQTTFDEEKEQYGDNFASYLAGIGVGDEATYRWLLECQELFDKTQTKLTDEYTEQKEAELRETAMTAKHILLSFPPVAEETEEEEGAEDPSGSDAADSTADDASEDTGDAGDDSTAEGDEAEEEEVPSVASQEEAEEVALEMAEELLAQIRYSGNSQTVFDRLMEEYTTDPGLEEYPDGYTFVEGDMVEEFYEGTKALADGEISEPIKSEHGYHIILRLPLDEEALDEHMESDAMVSRINSEVNTALSERLDALKEKLTVTGGDYYNRLDVTSIR